MNLVARIVELSQQPLGRCFQCQKCTAGCPTAPEMDLPPHEVVQRILLGEFTDVFGSSALWLCAGCEACGERCPNGISVGQLMPVLRRLAVEAGISPGDVRTAAFHAASVASVRQQGRLHEMMLLLDYGRRAFLGREGLGVIREFVIPGQRQGGMRDDVRVGLQLTLRRKLPLLANAGPAQEVRELCDRCEARERG